MYIEKVERLAVNISREEGIKLRDAIGELPGAMIKDTPLEKLYSSLVGELGHKYDDVML